MGGLVSSIFDIAEGNPVANETQQFGNLAGYETGTGEGLTTAGAGEELGILSGDPTRLATALAPEISGQQGQIQQNALQNANFGNRGGGTNASTQAAEGAGRGNIINLEGDLQSKTAGAAVGQGSNLLSQTSSNLGQEAGLAQQNRQRLDSDVGGIASSVAAIASPFLGGAAAPPAAIPGVTPGSDAGLIQAGNATPLMTDDEVGADPFGWGVS